MYGICMYFIYVFVFLCTKQCMWYFFRLFVGITSLVILTTNIMPLVVLIFVPCVLSVLGVKQKGRPEFKKIDKKLNKVIDLC
jgi:hypothetical protein